MAEEYTRWNAADYIKAEDDARLYLEACFEEDPGDGSVVRAALNDIARARGMTQLAQEVGITREGLYKALGPEGNPSLATVLRITRALGMQIRVAYQEELAQA